MDERRQHLRYPCPGQVKVRSLNTQVKLEGRVSDVGPGGCYIETLNPLPEGTRMELVIDAKGIEFTAIGEVKIAHTHMGMGAEFVEMKAEDRHKLATLLAKLSGEPVAAIRVEQAPVPATAAATAAPDAALPAEKAPALREALLKWYETHQSLSKEEFQEMCRSLKNSLSDLLIR